ncbi:SDR family NAD(P)-dependent oxidoreductase [Pseudoxanthobacter sp. M-2]|uniref:SDR family NAD(P)-dependent oxidoreductase n=1 Tax=Pseudoxanthobacter sp. M-2 TaxID=3078754 RepID=UPI0038FCF1D9
MPKTALITGATSGFGEATAKKFVANGWKVIVTGRRADRLATLVETLGGPTKAHGASFDIRDEAAMNTALDAVPEDFRGVDLLINNAGLALGTAPAPESKLDDWKTMIDTNITALVTMTKRMLPTLMERKGAIINISSTAALYPYMGGNVYGASKAFVKHFSYNLRCDVVGSGVRVTSVEPGLCESEFTLVRTGGNQAAYDALYKGAEAIQPEDIAETLWWVATLPPHININDIELMPVSQTWAGFNIHRKPA